MITADQKRATIEVERLGTFPLVYSIDPEADARFADNVRLGAEALDRWVETHGLRDAAQRLFGRRLTEAQLLQVLARLMAAAMAGRADDDLAGAIVEEHRKRHGMDDDWRFAVSLAVCGGRRTVQVKVRFGGDDECVADAQSRAS